MRAARKVRRCGRGGLFEASRRHLGKDRAGEDRRNRAADQRARQGIVALSCSSSRSANKIVSPTCSMVFAVDLRPSQVATKTQTAAQLTSGGRARSPGPYHDGQAHAARSSDRPPRRFLDCRFDTVRQCGRPVPTGSCSPVTVCETSSG